MPKPRMFILDANALLHRAWHALPPLTNPEGRVVNAVYGVMMVVMKLLEDQKPDGFVACWDTAAATFRHQAFAAYKAQREKQADELYAQIPLAQEGLRALGIDSLSLDGYEADDLIGTFALRALADGWEVVIVTGDRDALQLVQPGVSVLAFKKGVTETVLYDEAEVKQQYGLTPQQFVEYKAMRGDPSDNIPGIKGIGEKGATELLQEHGSLKEILRAAHDASSKIAKSQREKLLSAEDQIPALLALVKIITDVPIKWSPIKLSSPERAGIEIFLLRMGFRSLLKRLNSSSDEKIEQRMSGKIKESKILASNNEESPRQNIIKRVDDGLKCLAVLEKTEEVLVYAGRGAEGSLFSDSLEGVVIGSKSELFMFSHALIIEQSKIRLAITDLVESERVPKTTHDAKMQMTLFETYGIRARGFVFDSMLAAYILGAGERNHDLETVALRYAQTMLAPDSTLLARAHAVHGAIAGLRNEVREAGLESLLERFEIPLVPVLRQMEQVGIRVDLKYLKELSHDITKTQDELEKRMIKMVGHSFNPASPLQLAGVLFNDLKLPTKGIKKGKQVLSTASQELEKLRGVHPIIELIEDYREVSKLLSTYVDVMPRLADKGSRVHTTFNQAVTATGRLSSSNPNLQNIPIRTELGRKIRRAFVAAPGRQLVSCDYSQIELRIVAALANDETMLESFRKNEDIHTATAAAIWKIPLAKVTKEQRRSAKAINFGIVYGQGPQGLAQSAGISVNEARQFIQVYFETYTGIKKYLDETKTKGRSLGYVETLFGRRRLLPDINSPLPQLRAQAERMAINMPVQGTAADIIKLAMIELAKRLPEEYPDARILLQVHDELLLESPKDEATKVGRFAQKIMEQIEKLNVPMRVDVRVGENWDEMSTV